MHIKQKWVYSELIQYWHIDVLVCSPLDIALCCHTHLLLMVSGRLGESGKDDWTSPKLLIPPVGSKSLGLDMYMAIIYDTITLH